MTARRRPDWRLPAWFPGDESDASSSSEAGSPRPQLGNFGWWFDICEEDDDASDSLGRLEAAKPPKRMKKKTSDAPLFVPPSSSFSSSSTRRGCFSPPRAPREPGREEELVQEQERRCLPVVVFLSKTKRKRAVASTSLAFLLGVAALYALALKLNPNNKGVVVELDTVTPRESLRMAASQLRPKLFERLTARKFAQGTLALSPIFDRVGLSRMVQVNIDKLARFDRDASLEALVKAEATSGDWQKDDSATVAVQWNARILEFVSVLTDLVLQSPALLSTTEDFPPPTAGGQQREGGRRNTSEDHQQGHQPATLADFAKLAYEATLQQHHSKLLRHAARTMLALTPDHAAFFADHLGYPPQTWTTDLKKDLTDVNAALRQHLHLVKSILRHHSHVQV
eukprot:CAMPEP_0118919776 /NCGR_PEP_ID=MMETSP1166-20130328/18734_1 /TAXON_ID=1104430 /ORGANISM="Chrysoreinhardia sp, Strain CCMP3193" /LENGTH=396 /DNA_ID=CAMNT_0006860311 /DNA_START=86 /DNA_END=1276 /DNA_ORIENTATION=-